MREVKVKVTACGKPKLTIAGDGLRMKWPLSWAEADEGQEDQGLYIQILQEVDKLLHGEHTLRGRVTWVLNEDGWCVTLEDNARSFQVVVKKRLAGREAVGALQVTDRRSYGEVAGEHPEIAEALGKEDGDEDED